jgi:RND family efflux transporter MFP subunit
LQSDDVSTRRLRADGRAPTPLAEPPDHPGEGRRRGPTTSSATTGRRLAIFAAGLVIALLIAFLIVQHRRSSDESDLAAAAKRSAATAPSVVATSVEAVPSTQPLALPGETAAWYTSTIYARVTGYVGRWDADIGDHVTKGQVLATIETPDLDAELDAARAKLKVAQAEVKVREAEADFANTTYERWRTSPHGVVSDQEREDKKARAASAEAQLNAAHAQVDLNQGQVDRLNAFEAFKQVTAPFNGTIIERRIDIGNLVTAGSGANTALLYRVSQDDPMRVFVDVPQSVAADMKAGIAADITTDDLARKTFRGTITRTAEAINPQARTLRVEVDLPNPNEALVPGMYVQVAFQIKSKGLVQVPAAAMVFRTSGPQVALITDQGTIKFQDVTIARDDGNFVEIGSGLSPGDKIALNISNEIVDGEKVTVSETHDALAGAVRTAH